MSSLIVCISWKRKFFFVFIFYCRVYPGAYPKRKALNCEQEKLFQWIHVVIPAYFPSFLPILLIIKSWQSLPMTAISISCRTFISTKLHRKPNNVSSSLLFMRLFECMHKVVTKAKRQQCHHHHRLHAIINESIII